MKIIFWILFFPSLLSAQVSLNCYAVKSPKPKIAGILSCDLINRTNQEHKIDLAMVREGIFNGGKMSAMTMIGAQRAVEEFNKSSKTDKVLDIISFVTLGFSVAQGFIDSDKLSNSWKIVIGGTSTGLSLTRIFFTDRDANEVLPINYMVGDIIIGATSSLNFTILTHPVKDVSSFSISIEPYVKLAALDFIIDASNFLGDQNVEKNNIFASRFLPSNFTTNAD